MSSRVWDGHAELRDALQGLACAKGTSATRIKTVVNAALKYVKDYKRVVHDVEMFLWKADVEHRLAGLYAVDAIIRQSQLKFGAKDQFTKRFALHLTNTITAAKSIPADAQQHVRHVVHEWQSRGFYSVQQIQDAGGERYALTSSSSSTKHSESQREETTPKASSGKLASLLSIIKKQKERKDQEQEAAAAAAPQSILGDGHHAQRSAPSLLGSPPRAARIAPTGLLSPRSQQLQQRPVDSDYARHRSSQDVYESGDRKRSVGDALLPPPPASAAIGGRSRREHDAGDWQDERNAKKPRGSRWGPPKPVDTTVGGDANYRPSPVNTVPPRRGEPLPQQYQSNGPHGGAVSMPPSGQYAPPMRADAWQQQGMPDPMRQPSPGARSGGYGGTLAAEREPFHDAKRLDQAAPHTFGPPRNSGNQPDDARAMMESPRHGDRSSAGGPPGDQLNASSSREICRKFIAGRCPYGANCWYTHDPHVANDSRARTEMYEARRKTVLCANFPRGTCRYGDRCNFAHGELDLDQSAVSRLRGPSSGGGAGDHAVSSPTVGHAHAFDHRHAAAAAPLAAPPAAAAMAQLNRPNGTATTSSPHHHHHHHHAVYNEVQGDRGKSGDSSLSHHHAPPQAPPVTAGGVAGGPVGSVAAAPIQSAPFQRHPPSASSPQGSMPTAAAAAVGVARGSVDAQGRGPPAPPSLQAGAAKDTFAPSGGPPPGMPPPPLGSFPPRGGFAGMPPRPPPPGMMMGPPRPPPLGMMMMGPPRPPLHATPNFAPPAVHQQPPARPPVATALKSESRPGPSSVDPVDEDDEPESAAPEFTLQYDDED